MRLAAISWESSGDDLMCCLSGGRLVGRECSFKFSIEYVGYELLIIVSTVGDCVVMLLRCVAIDGS